MRRLESAEVRRRNFIPPDRFPYATLFGNSYDSGQYTRALDHALATAGYAEWRRQQAAATRALDAYGSELFGFLVHLMGNETDASEEGTEDPLLVEEPGRRRFRRR